LGQMRLRGPLRKRGFTDIPIYNTFPADKCRAPELRDFLLEDLDWVIFTSASTVEGFAGIFGPEKMQGQRAKGLKALCIGRQTAEAAEKHGMNTYTSENATLESIVEKLKEVTGRQYS